MGLWTSRSHALDYLAHADQSPHCTEEEAILLDQVPATVQRILDLGTGDGRLLALLRLERKTALHGEILRSLHRAVSSVI
jgi:tRNA (cmo5U34)-methyltransferase